MPEAQLVFCLRKLGQKSIDFGHILVGESENCLDFPLLLKMLQQLFKITLLPPRFVAHSRLDQNISQWTAWSGDFSEQRINLEIWSVGVPCEWESIHITRVLILRLQAESRESSLTFPPHFWRTSGRQNAIAVNPGSSWTGIGSTEYTFFSAFGFPEASSKRIFADLTSSGSLFHFLLELSCQIWYMDLLEKEGEGLVFRISSQS